MTHTHTYTHTLDLAGQLLLSSAKQNEEVKECKTLAVCCFFFRASTRQKGRTKTAAKGSYSCVDCPPAWMAEELQTVRRKKQQQQQQQHVNQTCHSIAVSQSTIEEVELPFNEAEISAGLLLQKTTSKLFKVAAQQKLRSQPARRREERKSMTESNEPLWLLTVHDDDEDQDQDWGANSSWLCVREVVVEWVTAGGGGPGHIIERGREGRSGRCGIPLCPHPLLRRPTNGRAAWWQLRDMRLLAKKN